MMFHFPGMARRPGAFRPRTRLLRAVLVCMLVLTSVLAHQAYMAARSHQTIAERVLKDYVTFAEWELTRHVTSDLEAALSMGLMPLARTDGAGLPPLPAASRNPDDDGCGCASFGAARSYFRLDVRDGHVTANGPLAGTTRDALIRVATAPPVDAASNGAQAGTERASMRRMVGRGDSGVMIAIVDGQPHVIGYRVRRNAGSPVTVDGFDADAEGVARIFGGVLATTPLLPPSLAAPGQYRSQLAVQVTDGEGHELYRSSAERGLDSAIVSDEVLPARLGGLRIRMALRAETAHTLVIGGLPRSRLPMLLGILLLTTALVIVAAVQLRREYELARLRSDFISGVSHELRTPLAQIRMFAETLLLGRVRSADEGRRSLEIIEREARRLTQLVENVLCFSKTERQAPQVTREWTDVRVLLSEIRESFAPLARARGVTIRMQLDEALHAPVDRMALRQILLNLLDNAVKYGPAGQTIAIGAARDGDHNLRIVVDDQGHGIREHERGRIWEPFFRLERARTSAVAGAGIGLAVVRDLVTLHGGRAWVDTAPGGGARFVIELPGARQDPPPAAIASTRFELPATSRPLREASR